MSTPVRDRSLSDSEIGICYYCEITWRSVNVLLEFTRSPTPIRPYIGEAGVAFAEPQKTLIVPRCPERTLKRLASIKDVWPRAASTVVSSVASQLPFSS